MTENCWKLFEELDGRDEISMEVLLLAAIKGTSFDEVKAMIKITDWDALLKEAKSRKMVKLDAAKFGNNIIISCDSFEHLLNCIANQKFLPIPDKQTKLHKKQTQDYIDDFYDQCRKLLNNEPN